MNLDAQVKQDKQVIEALNKKFSIFAPNSARVVNVIEEVKMLTTNNGKVIEIVSFEKEVA